MKCLILAAGFGKRLLPHTEIIPKPLFKIDSKPVIGHTIEKLIQHGCTHIIINTHHLHGKIENYIKESNYPIKIHTIFEPEILETGGAVKNTRAFFKDSPFLIINSDILFDINLAEPIKTHIDNDNLATLLLHKHDKYNKIEIDNNNFIKDFNSVKNPFAFTGIQIVSPKIFTLMPDNKKFSIIELYKSLIEQKIKINAFIIKGNYFWEDIGTTQTYKMSCIKYQACSMHGCNLHCLNRINVKKLTGDGSDRRWYRIKINRKTYIASDHGINTLNHNSVDADFPSQLNSFIKIGNHLYNKKITVPKILNFDSFSGVAIVQDLGDIHLKDVVLRSKPKSDIFDWYKKVCDSLVMFSSNGYQNFDKSWTCETDEYTKQVILEKECRYFIDSFVIDYLKRDTQYETYLNEFKFIAENCIKSAHVGLMHRDMQSKNIMIKDNTIFFIDFQSARKGPIEYDLASLLIDPYVKLDQDLKEKILSYFIEILSKNHNFDTKLFLNCYKYCCVARNLQILGAFSYLSKVKKKKQFEAFIPYALNTLKQHINLIDTTKTAGLNTFIKKLHLKL